MGSRIIVGDVHGCLRTLKALVAKLPPNIPITISGDLIDRGPYSAGVVQYCIDNNIEVTVGNHEKMMLKFFETYPDFSTDGRAIRDDIWLMNGGAGTLHSYGFELTSLGYYSFSVEAKDENSLKLFKKHIEYFKTLPIYRVYEDVVNEDGRKLVVSHSSINKVWKWSDKKRKEYSKSFEETVIWGRPNTINDVPEIFNAFGHTPQSTGPRIKVPYANLDTGCCFSKKESREAGYGVLTALMYPEMVIYQQENVDDEVL